MVKGVQSVDDARRVAELGVDGIILSNHGGRQLDRAPIPFHLLPAGGARGRERHRGPPRHRHHDRCRHRGVGGARARKFTLIGRAYLYGLMAGGRDGVDRAIDILRSEIERTMRLLGVTSLAELTPEHVTQLERLAPRPRG